MVAQKYFVYCCTNGLLLERLLAKVPRSKYLCWVVHMDGMEEKHDESVARAGVFKKAVNSIETALDQGYRVCTNTTVFRDSDAEDLWEMFRLVSGLGVEGSMISPGYEFKDAPDQDLFLSRREARAIFKKLLAPAKTSGMKFYNNPLYLNFLQGSREYQCTAWSNPTYTIMGWRKPCYPLADEHVPQVDELFDEKLWERYGVGKDPRCANCMMHCGFESATIFQAVSTPKGLGNVNQVRRCRQSGHHGGVTACSYQPNAMSLTIIASMEYELDGLRRELRASTFPLAPTAASRDGEPPAMELHVIGVGKHQAESSTHRLLNPDTGAPDTEAAQPKQLLLVGFTGAVDPSLRSGDLVLSPRYFKTDEGTNSPNPPFMKGGDEGFFSKGSNEGTATKGGKKEFLTPDPAMWEQANHAAAQMDCKVATVDSLTVRDLVATTGEKAAIVHCYPVGIVNMEDYWVAAAAREAGVPFLAARVVLDQADQALPPYLRKLAGHRFRAALGLLTSPRRIPALVRLSGQASAVRSVLTQFTRVFAAQANNASLPVGAGSFLDLDRFRGKGMLRGLKRKECSGRVYVEGAKLRVLVTGATGFVGGNLARELWRRGYDVRALVRPGSNTLTIDGTGIQQVPGDILDRESMNRAVQGCEGNFHCAGAYTFWSPRPRFRVPHQRRRYR